MFAVTDQDSLARNRGEVAIFSFTTHTHTVRSIVPSLTSLRGGAGPFFWWLLRVFYSWLGAWLFCLARLFAGRDRLNASLCVPCNGPRIFVQSWNFLKNLISTIWESFCMVPDKSFIRRLFGYSGIVGVAAWLFRGSSVAPWTICSFHCCCFLFLAGALLRASMSAVRLRTKC